jgi:hypothetical protein
MKKRPHDEERSSTLPTAHGVRKQSSNATTKRSRPLPIREAIMNGPLALMRGILPGKLQEEFEALSKVSLNCIIGKGTE